MLAAVLAEVKGLSAVETTVKNDILLPLKDGLEDVRLSELMINSQELKEVSAELSSGGNSSAEVDWNYKAPSSFASLELYKNLEVQLTFNTVFSFLQTRQDALSKAIEANQESTKYMLANFKVPDELNFYLDYVKRTDFKPAPNDLFYNKQVKQQEKQLRNTTPTKKRSSVVPKSDAQSIASNNSSKRLSKLKSKVGSLFGRKKKTQSVHSFGDAIAEDELSIASPPTQLSRNASVRTGATRLHKDYQPSLKTPTTESFPTPGFYTKPEGSPREAPGPNGTGKSTIGGPSGVPSGGPSGGPSGPSGAGPGTYGTSGPSGSGPGAYGTSSSSGAGAGAGPSGFVDPKPSYQSSGSSSSAPSAPSGFTPALTPRPAHTPTRTSVGQDDSPNVVRYDSDSSDDEPAGSRLSMLHQHDLGEGEIKKDTEQIPKPEQRGFQEAPTTKQPSFQDVPTAKQPGFQDTPTSKQPGFQDVPTSKQPGFQDVPEPISKQGQPGYAGSSPLSFQPIQVPEMPEPTIDKQPPRPPPSRKVLHHEERSRKDINSQMFHNIPHARDSVIADNGFEQTRNASYGAIAGIPEDREGSFGSTSQTAAHPGPGFHSGPGFQSGAGLNSAASLHSGNAISQQNTGTLMKNHDFFKHFVGSTDSSVGGLNSSVSEVINASFKDGAFVKSQIVGEIAFNYNPQGAAPEESVMVRIPDNFDKVILNPTFVTTGEQSSGASTYRLSTGQITSTTLGGLKYLVKLTAQQVPVNIVHVWKHEAHQSSLMLSLKMNPAFRQVVLNGLVISAALAPGVTTTSALSKPVGSFNVDANRVTWRYTQPLVLDAANPEEKVIARFMTEGLATEHEGGLQLKFQINEPEIHFASVQDIEGRELPVTRYLTSGNYSAVEGK